jgi:hypothetical protein
MDRAHLIMASRKHEKEWKRKRRIRELQSLVIKILTTLTIAFIGNFLFYVSFKISDSPPSPRPITESSITTPRIVAPPTAGGGGKMSELREKCKAAGLC